MPQSVILSVSPLPQAKTNRAYSFQPVASHNPTAWTSSPLPAGLSLNASTGVISGTPTAAGAYSFVLRAGSPVTLTGCAVTAAATAVTCASTSGLRVGDTVTGNGLLAETKVVYIWNATTFYIDTPAAATVSSQTFIAGEDRWSAEMLFTLDVALTPPAPPTCYASVVIDLGTRTVTYEAPAAAPKDGDTWLQQIFLVRDGVGIDLDVSSLKCGIKLDEDSDPVLIHDTFTKVGSGASTVYRLAGTLTPADLADAFELGFRDVASELIPATAADLRISKVLMLVEYDIEFTNTGSGYVGSNPAVWSSATVAVPMVRQIVT